MHNFYSRYVLPAQLLVLTSVLIVVIVLALIDVRNTSYNIDLISESFAYDRYSVAKLGSADKALDSINVVREDIKTALKDMEVLAKNSLDSNTISFLFTLFSIALLSGGVYVLNLMQAKLNIYDEIEEENYNNRQILSILFHVDFIYSLVMNINVDDTSATSVQLRDIIKIVNKILGNRRFDYMDSNIGKTLTQKLSNIIHTLNNVLPKLQDETKSHYSNFINDIQQIDNKIVRFPKNKHTKY